MDGAILEHDVFALSRRGRAEAVSFAAAPQFAHPGSDFNCDDFIVGPENRLTASAILALLSQPSDAYCPLVLHGASGTGKSHLVNYVARSRPDAVCVSGADFARQLATAIDSDVLPEFRARYRTTSLFVLDDIHQLVGRKAALQELQHLLDLFESRETPVLVTSRLPPHEIPHLPASLRSRLDAGLVLAVSSPGAQARQIILDRLAASRGITLSPDAAKLLTRGLCGNAADLRGALIALQLGSSGAKTESAGDNASAAVGINQVRRFLSRRHANLPTLSQITVLVARNYGLSPASLSSPSRRRQVVLARAVAIYLGRKICGASLKSLGKHFGGRDHTTALHSFRQVQSQLSRDLALRGTLNTLQSLLTAGV